MRPLQIEAAPFVLSEGARPPVVRTTRPPRARRPRPRPQPERAERVELPRVGSRALGKPYDGRLLNGVQLPLSGPDWLTWDPIFKRVPNRPERRWGTDVLLRSLTDVLREYRAANPQAPPVLVGDLSRPRGGVFDKRYGGLGHASHQNGLDVDVYYPRRDRRPIGARRASQVDRVLAQDLVDRFVAAGAQFAFVGIKVKLRGPDGVVQAIPYHEDHVHVRIRNPRGPR